MSAPKYSTYGMWDPHAKQLDKQWWETTRDQYDWMDDFREGIGLNPLTREKKCD